MKITEKYVFFWKDKIAQWNMLPFQKDGVTYNCAEQYMMVQKALLFNDKEMFNRILDEKNPSKQQKLGREIKNFDLETWDKNKERIVYEGNILKFSQNSELLDILLSTEDKILVEASPFDLIWGIGLSQDDPDIENESKWKGQNLLGKTLMRVRESLRSNFVKSI